MPPRAVRLPVILIPKTVIFRTPNNSGAVGGLRQASIIFSYLPVGQRERYLEVQRAVYFVRELVVAPVVDVATLKCRTTALQLVSDAAKGNDTPFLSPLDWRVIFGDTFVFYIRILYSLSRSLPTPYSGCV